MTGETRGSATALLSGKIRMKEQEKEKGRIFGPIDCFAVGIGRPSLFKISGKKRGQLIVLAANSFRSER